MPIDDPFPLEIAEKVNSPHLLAWFQQFGESGYLSAEEINKMIVALEYLKENLSGGEGTIPGLDPVLNVSGISNKTITLVNSVNDKRKAVFNPNTVNGPELAVYEDDGAGNSVLAFTVTSYALQLLGSLCGGIDFSFDPFAGIGMTDGSNVFSINNTGITINGQMFFYPNGVGGGNLASEDFVNALIEGVKTKNPVRAASTGNVVLSGLQTQDGVSLNADDSFLVKDNTDQTENGPYIVKSGAWIRRSDANTGQELVNALVPVLEGTTNANIIFRQQTAPVTLGVSNIVFQSYQTLVPDATSSTKGKMKLYTVSGTNTDGTITQALFKTEIDTINTSLSNKKTKDIILGAGGSYPATVAEHYIVMSNTQTITDPGSPITGAAYTMFVHSCTLTLGGVAATYRKVNIYRFYTGTVWENVITKSMDAIADTGSNILFDVAKIYNSVASPSTSNITDDLTYAQIGVVQKIYSNKAVEPTYPAGWVKIGAGTYAASTLNIIYAEWVGGSRVEYWITQ